MYKIKIEDLKTGTVEVDTESDCIIAVINLPGEGAAQNFSASCATASVVLNVADSAVELSKKTVGSVVDSMFGGDNHE